MTGEAARPAAATTSFPRQHARTRRFSLGVPRSIVSGIGAAGPVVLFLRSDGGDDPVNHLWRHDPRTGTTEKLVDARALVGDEVVVPAEERARRERAREQAGGIVGYAVDRGLRLAVFTLGGSLYSVMIDTGELATHPTAGPAFDPRPAPDGSAIAYHAAGGLHLVDLADGPARPGRTRELVAEPSVTWGRAEFAAAEEMGRTRGYWWAGDSSALAVARVDESAVASWTIADPAQPWQPPATHAYPAAGTANADVSLWVVEVAGGRRTEVVWDRQRDEYLAHVGWGSDPLTLLVQPRDQRAARVLTADRATGATRLRREWHDDAWVELVDGAPAWLGERLLTVEDRHDLGPAGTRVVCRDGEPLTPAGLQVRALLDVTAGPGGDAITFTASPAEDSTRIDAYRLTLDADADAVPVLRRVDGGTDDAGITHLVVGSPAAPAPEGGGHDHGHASTDPDPGATGQQGAGSGEDGGPGDGEPPQVLVNRTLTAAAPTVTVRWQDSGGARSVEHRLDVVAETPVLTARPRLLELGDDRLRAALFLPDDGPTSLPVLLDPYGGPHGQRVVAAQAAHLASQWLADQGFAVLVVDGRGTPGRGPAWERAVHGDLATGVLDDQVAALHAAATIEPRLDVTRVGIRGWSFGGYLAALAVLRRPDVFRAAVAGAPVTDWRLYDTHYTERYLGHPDDEAGAYEVSSLVDRDATLGPAADWDPGDPPSLLLIHGLADDNVVAAHTLRLSSALLADGRRHEVLPLSGVTHMTPQEIVAERLLDHEVAFLQRALRPR